ncbi:MAG: hypothetical protein Q8R02_17620 [Hyphomonadaceae bacterium]|nr:hypothetical protein [Hyphomonadaceae bacterium]
MRMIMLAVAAMLAAPAVAQTPLDGKAVLLGKAGEALAGGVATKEQVRGVIVAAIGDGLSPEESDFFKEVAAGGAVDAAVGGKTVRVGPLTGDALATARLIAAPPNLNTLWKERGEPTLQLIEMARWGDAPRNRVTGFMANKLYSAWTKSDVLHAYTPWVQEYAGINNALSEIADPAVKTEGKLLLKSAVEQVFAKCAADMRVAPPLFLYEFALVSVGVPRP